MSVQLGSDSGDERSPAAPIPARGLTQALRFALVGVLNTLICYLSFSLLLWFGLHYVIAAALGWGIAMAHSFLLNKRWTFAERSAPAPRQIAAFVAANAISLGINLAALAALVEAAGWDPALGNLLALAASTAVNFLACRYWVFTAG